MTWPQRISQHTRLSHILMCAYAPTSLAPKVSCSTLSQLHGSDHFPLLTKILLARSNPGTPKPKFIIEKANWEKFQLSANVTMSKYPLSSNVNKEANALKNNTYSSTLIDTPDPQEKTQVCSTILVTKPSSVKRKETEALAYI